MLDILLFALLSVLVGSAISWLFSLFSPPLHSACADWNKYHVMELALFATGATSYALFQTYQKNPLK